MSEARVEPVRVRLYGLVTLTKGRYLAQVAVALALALGLLVLWWLRWPAVRQGLQGASSPVMDRAIAMWDAAPWVIGALAGLQAVEAFFVLRAFRRKEALASTARGAVATGGPGEARPAGPEGD